MNENKLRQAIVKYDGRVAGYVSETGQGFSFVYDAQYCVDGRPLSISLPLRHQAYESKELFSFFQGLLPEGWYLDIVSAITKIDSHDTFGILIATAQNTVGAVTIHPLKNQG